MEKWWDKRYIDQRNWIMDNFQELTLTLEEGMVLLMIVYFNEYGLELSLNILSEKCHVSSDKMDDIINSLRTKGYLEFKIVDKHVRFTLDGLFDEKDHQTYDDASLYDLFESELGRILTQKELSMINGWLQEYPADEIIKALREALIYQKRDFNYIQRILLAHKQEH